MTDGRSGSCVRVVTTIAIIDRVPSGEWPRHSAPITPSRVARHCRVRSAAAPHRSSRTATRRTRHSPPCRATAPSTGGRRREVAAWHPRTFPTRSDDCWACRGSTSRAPARATQSQAAHAGSVEEAPRRVRFVDPVDHASAAIRLSDGGHIVGPRCEDNSRGQWRDGGIGGTATGGHHAQKDGDRENGLHPDTVPQVNAHEVHMAPQVAR